MLTTHSTHWPTRCLLADAARHGLWCPFLAPLTCNTRVTSPEHFQDTRHLEFDLTGSGMRYAPGDLLTIFPQQSQSALSAFYKRTNLNPNAWVKIEAETASGSGHCAPVQVVMHIGTCAGQVSVCCFACCRHLQQAQLMTNNSEHGRVLKQRALPTAV